jgi:transposase
MAIIGGFDLHRRQLTYDYLDVVTGEVERGRVVPADRGHLRSFLARFEGQGEVAFAVEGCTGWRYVVEELERAGIGAHLAEPAETAAKRGRKRRAKTDRSDARHLRELLGKGDLPESWIPPAQVLEARARVRLYKDLEEERTGWLQRVQPPCTTRACRSSPPSPAPLARPGWLRPSCRPPASRPSKSGCGSQVGSPASPVPLRAELARCSRRQPGCRALRTTHFGIGPITSVAIWAEMGDTRRFSSSDDAVRHAGLDLTVYASDSKRAKGHLARQGPATLRWALYEAAVCATRPNSPDHAYFLAVKRRADGHLGVISVARKLARRVHHTLRALGDQAWEPVPAV